jgi:hypothetical protein
MIIVPFTVEFDGYELDIPADENAVKEFLVKSDLYKKSFEDEYASLLEVPIKFSEISVAYGVELLMADNAITVEELNEIYYSLSDWDSENALFAAVEYFGAKYVSNHTESEFQFYDVKDEYDLGEEIANEYYQIEGSLSSYIDYESFGQDYLNEHNGGMTSYGVIIHKDY